MLVKEGSLFGEDLFGLGALPAEIYGGHAVLYQMRDSRGYGLPGVKLQAVQDGKVWDETVSEGRGFAALFVPRSDNVEMKTPIYVVAVPPEFIIPKNYVDMATIPAGGKTYFKNVKDRAEVIFSSYPRAILGNVPIVEVDLQFSAQAAATAEARKIAAERDAAAAEARREEAEARVRELQETAAGTEMLMKAEAEAREAERVVAAKAKAAADAAATAAAMTAGKGITPYLPYIIGGGAVIGIGITLYLVLSKKPVGA